jgi:addiction module RelE/StbE family toxin
MKVKLHKNFEQRYFKFSHKFQTKIDERIKLFTDEPFHPLLNNHALRGKYDGCRSINITGDYRAIYRLLDNDTVYFIEINNHSNLYKK